MEIYCGGNGQEQVKATIIDEPFGLTTIIYGTAFGLCDFGQQNQTQYKTNKQTEKKNPPQGKQTKTKIN